MASTMTARSMKISLQSRFAGAKLRSKTAAARPAPILATPQAAFFSKTKATAAAPKQNVSRLRMYLILLHLAPPRSYL